MNHKGNLPESITVTEAWEHEVAQGRRIAFSNGSIVAVDRGYTYDEWYKTYQTRVFTS